MGLLDALMDPRFRRDVAQGLLDAGNRGVVAGLLGAPVDMAQGVANAGRMAAGYLGHKAGLLSADQMPQPVEKPVGGSEWIGDLMQRAGMVSDNRNPVAETLAGAVLPVAAVPAGRALYAAEQAAPAVARDFASTPSVQNAVNGYMERMGMKLPITVWHGSPHKFDKFDASKIGTGEGAQAYGHGIYTAESPNVANQYAESLGSLYSQGYNVNGIDDAVKLPAWVVDRIKSKASSVDDMISEFQKRIAEVEANKASSIQPWMEDQKIAGLTESIGTLEKLRGVPLDSARQGNLYKVDLPDSAVAKMLDWDKPLSQQPEAVKALQKVQDRFPGLADALQSFELDSSTGQTVNRYMSRVKDPSAAANAFREIGIPGIRYLDGGSRGTGQGTSNFVVFPGNEGLLTILERNGIPLP